MNDLHAVIGAALDREHAQAVKTNSARTLRRVEADRRVLGRHVSGAVGDYCRVCTVPAPCPDLLDLAARYDVQP